MTILYIILSVLGALLLLWVVHLWVKSRRLMRWAARNGLSPIEAEQLSRDYSSLEQHVRTGRERGEDMSDYDDLILPRGTLMGLFSRDKTKRQVLRLERYMMAMESAAAAGDVDAMADYTRKQNEIGEWLAKHGTWTSDQIRAFIKERGLVQLPS